jgi:large subunit ribosomal protein L1
MKLVEKVDKTTTYSVDDAVKLLKETSQTKFDESIDLAIRLGVDPKKGDQNVRGTTNLPHGTGKTKKVAVLASGDAADQAKEAGADTVGDEDLIKQIQEGFRDFDLVVAHQEMAPQIGKIGRFLGPKTPNKKNGTLTTDVAGAVKEIKSAQRIEYRLDRAGNCHLPLGKVSFTEDQIKENFLAAVDALMKARPASAKGRYLQNVAISSTMGPGIKVDPSDAAKASGH